MIESGGRDDLKAVVNGWRAAGKQVGFVPTMGNLHRGHLALVSAAKAECDRVVVSIFVNPTQFGPDEDFASYPRTRESDLEALRKLGCDLAFVPTPDVIYPHGTKVKTVVAVPSLADTLCGLSRPAFFPGICLVVCRLFHLVNPDIAYFGEKDFQKLQIIRAMTCDLGFSIAIRGLPTLREADGLAMSSRNHYLSKRERAAAPQLHQALVAAGAELASGRSVAKVEQHWQKVLDEAGFEVDYFSIRDQETLARYGDGHDRSLRVFAAALLGRTRLIDNVAVPDFLVESAPGVNE